MKKKKVSAEMRTRYLDYLEEVLDAAIEHGSVTVALSEDVIGEMYVTEDSQGSPIVRWRSTVRLYNDPGGSS